MSSSSASNTNLTVREDLVSVDVPGASDVRDAPRATYEKLVGDFATEILEEASRIEVATRGASSNAIQYTSAHFEKANIWVRDRGYVPRKSKLDKAARIINPVALLVAGIAGPHLFDQQAAIGWVITTVVSVIFACVTLPFGSMTKGGR